MAVIIYICQQDFTGIAIHRSVFYASSMLYTIFSTLTIMSKFFWIDPKFDITRRIEEFGNLAVGLTKLSFAFSATFAVNFLDG